MRPAAQLIGHHLYPDDVRESLIGGAERDAETFLKEQAEQIGSKGGKVAEPHLRSGTRTRRSSARPRAWAWA